MIKLNVALIGCGCVSHIHLDALTCNNENVVALCDIELEKAIKSKEKFGLHCNVYKDYIEMLDNEEIDVVHICTPHYLHAEMIIEALKRNINVLCEKPLAISYEQLDAIKLATESSKARLGTILQRRYEPTSKKILECLNGEQVLSASGNLSWCRDAKYYGLAEWRGTKKYEGGGVMINQALHTLDIVTYFMGFPDTVIAHTFNDSLKDVIDVEDGCYAIFKYNDGRKFTIFASNANNLSHELSFSLISKTHNIYYFGENLLVDNKQVLEKTEISDAGKKEWGYGHYYIISDYYNCLRDNREFDIGFDEGSKVVRLILGIYKSNDKEIKL